MKILRKIKNKFLGIKESKKIKSVWEVTGLPKPEERKRDIIVNTDTAFYDGDLHRSDEIKSKIDPIHFESLEFEEDITDYSLELLSPEAKSKIIDIIKKDNVKRLESNKIKTTGYNE